MVYKRIVDANDRELRVGDRVRFATWGMFDMFVKYQEKSGRKVTDPEYVTHVNYGTVRELLNEEEGTLYIIPDGENGEWHICTKPSWNARSEFIEIIERKSPPDMG